MRRKFLILTILLCLIGIAKPDWIKNRVAPLGDQVMQTLSIQQSSISLDPFAKNLGGSLSQPISKNPRVDGVISVAGSIVKYAELSSPYLWIEISYLGKKKVDLPTSMHYYTLLSRGDFKQDIRLFHGKGNYMVKIRVAGEDKNTYYPFATFEVINTADTIARDISYSPVANEIGLKMDAALSGYEVHSNTVAIGGGFSKPYPEKDVLIQVRKGKQVWRKVISSTGSSFQENVPLLFGKGIHEIQVMIPDRKRTDVYLQGATLFVDNQSDKKWNPIQYTRLYKERGIQLETPLAGGSHQGLQYRIAGNIQHTVNPKKLDHLVIRTLKGKDEATYFIPVVNDRFDDTIYFRFGNGSYQVVLLVPEDNQHNGYFRFFTTAQFTVSVNGVQDARDLLPSRGIHPDNVQVIRLANQLVRGKMSEMEKARAIFTYVANTMTYDMKKLKFNTFLWNDSDLKALQTKQGVCQDYVFLTLSLLRAAGIPSRFVEGTADGQAHAWIESYLGRSWIAMDPTWGSGYIQGGKFIKKLDLFYFNPPSQKIAKTHRRTGIIY